MSASDSSTQNLNMHQVLLEWREQEKCKRQVKPLWDSVLNMGLNMNIFFQFSIVFI